MDNKTPELTETFNQRVPFATSHSDRHAQYEALSPYRSAGQSLVKPNALFGNITVTKDQTVANPIQAAINRCAEVGGGRVLINTGTYSIANTITLKDNVSLVGQDPFRTELNFQFGTANIVTETGASNLEISNLSLNYCNNGSAVVYMDVPYLCELNNLIFTGNRSVTGTTFAVLVDSGYLIRMNNIDEYSSGGFVKAISDSAEVNMVNCSALDVDIGLEGDPITTGFDFSHFTNLDIHATKYAVKGDFYACVFNGGHYYNYGTTGTVVALDSVTTNNNVFQGCVIQNVMSNGVPLLIDSAGYNQFVGNTVVGTNTDGVRLQNGANDNTFVGNRITGHGTNSFGTAYSVRVGTASNNVSDTLITGNNLQVLGVTAGTVLNNGTNTVLSGNLT